MDIHQSFLDEIIAHPKDDSYRLIYADWLEEHGQEGRAEFIRVQCKLAKTPIRGVKSILQEISALRCRERFLLNKERVPVLGRRSKLRKGHWTSQAYRWMPYSILANTEWCTFRRGFVESVEVSLSDWLSYGPAMCKEAPLRRVKIADIVSMGLIKEIDGLFYMFRRTLDRVCLGSYRPHLLAIYDLIQSEAFPTPHNFPYSKGFTTHCKARNALNKACLLWARQGARLGAVTPPK